MKVAILTLPLHTNYGGILQAYALQTVLERMGHDVSVISPEPIKVHHALWKMPLVYLKRIIKKTILHRDISVRYDIYSRPRQHTDKFIEKYIHSFIVTNWSELKGLYDAYVVGSDQIWRPKYANPFPGINNAYLQFAKDWNIKRIAYAISFGTNTWEYSKEDENLCKDLLQCFNGVSVREESGIQLCCNHFEIKPLHVLDPTMLLTREDYLNLINRAKTKPSKGSLMCYILDPTPHAEKVIKHYEDTLGLRAFHTNSLVESSNAREKDKIQKPVEQWLRSFMDAEFVITDSFHACVFSIIFQKPFLVLSNESRGNARIESMLQMFDLDNRRIDTCDVISHASDIDFKRVSSMLERMRITSFGFLHSHL